jgi:hypothetical protein
MTRQMPTSAVIGERAYGSIISLSTGMVLMFLGFFMCLGGWSQIISVGVMLTGGV